MEIITKGEKEGVAQAYCNMEQMRQPTTKFQ